MNSVDMTKQSEGTGAQNTQHPARPNQMSFRVNQHSNTQAFTHRVSLPGIGGHVAWTSNPN